MCKPASSIPGPVEAVGGLADAVGTAVQYAWRPFFVLLGAAFIYAHFWWLLGMSATVAVGTWAVMRIFSRHVLIQAPASLRQVALPVPSRIRTIALPRNLAITRKRRAIPAAARALPAAVIEPTRVVTPARRAAR